MLLDHRLGDGRDGITCLASLRGLPLARQPAVALITGDWTVTDRTAELKALNATLVFKPCDLDDVDDLVARLAPED